MPVRRFGVGLAALLIYTAFLAAFAPATLLGDAVRRLSEGKVTLADGRGSVWAGEGYLEIRDTTGTTGISKSVSWRFQPLSLLRAQIGFKANMADADQPFLFAISPSGLQLVGVDVAAPASALGLAGPAMAMIGPTGDLRIRIAEMTIAGTQVSGGGSLEWQFAGSALTPVSPLGHYELRFQIEGGKVTGVLRTLSGPLFLKGKGPGGTIRPPLFGVIAHVEPGVDSQLSPFLRLIAVEQSTGTFDLQLVQDFGKLQRTAPDTLRR